MDELITAIRKEARARALQTLKNNEVQIYTPGWFQNYGVRAKFSPEDTEKYCSAMEDAAVGNLHRRLIDMAFASS